MNISDTPHWHEILHSRFVELQESKRNAYINPTLLDLATDYVLNIPQQVTSDPYCMGCGKYNEYQSSAYICFECKNK